MEKQFTGFYKNIAGFIVAAIILSFLFTGFQGIQQSNDSVGEVEGYDIKIREYQNALNAQLNQYSQMFGKNLTKEQIRQFRVREQVMNQLIQQKTMLYLAHESGFKVSNDEIKDSIKETPFFKTNNKFDVNRYKSLLRANNFTPQDYETIVREELAAKKASALISSLTVPKSISNELFKLENSGLELMAFKIVKNNLYNYIEVPKSDIKAFVTDEKNKGLLNSLYNSRINEFSKPEQVLASHILLTQNENESKEAFQKRVKKIQNKVNAKNFSQMANKHSEDKSLKGKGGDLGWFGRGRMTANFETAAFKLPKGQISKPIETEFGTHIIYVRDKKKAEKKSLEDVKETLAKSHLQKTATDKLKALEESILSQAKELLAQKNAKKLKELSKKYSLVFQENLKLKHHTSRILNTEIKDLNTLELAKNSIGKVQTQKVIQDYILFLPLKQYTEEDVKKSETYDQSLSSQLVSRAFETIKEGLTISTNTNLL